MHNQHLAVVGAGIISSLAVDRGLPFWIALLLGIFLTGVLSLIIERTFLRPMVGEPVFSVAFLTIGIDILLKNFLDNWIGIKSKIFRRSISNLWKFWICQLGGVKLKYLEIAALVTAIVVIIAFVYFFQKI